MTKGKAIFLAILTLWPIIYMFLFMGWMFLLVFTSTHNPPPKDLPISFIFVFILHGLTMFLNLGMIAYYIIHVFKTPLITQDKKALWAVVIFLGNILAMPVYWYLYIWKPLQTEKEPG